MLVRANARFHRAIGIHARILSPSGTTAL